MPTELHSAARRLVRRRRETLRHLVERLLRDEVDEADGGGLGSEPDESAIREMAILIAVELAIKLLEADMPGGVSLSRRLVDSAAQSAIARVEMVEKSLRTAAD